MVHALEKVHSLLAPGGILIDIHPFYEAPAIEVHIDARVTQEGMVQEDTDFVEFLQADQALAEVVRQGWFALERAGQFTFLTHADGVTDWHADLTADWNSYSLDDDTIRRVDELLGVPGQPKEVVMREHAHIARLRPERR